MLRPASADTVAMIQHRTSRRVHSLNYQVVENHLLLGSFNDVLLNAALGHQPVHTHLHTLSTAVKIFHHPHRTDCVTFHLK